MRRVEIMAAQAILEDILEALEHYEVPMHYTIIPTAQGKGNTIPKLGDGVWPEENFVLIMYCEEVILEKIEKALHLVQKKYDHEGIGYFVI
ncbi:MAG: PG0541 family transporter-associated protein [Sphaerochaetaceae bacterium]